MVDIQTAPPLHRLGNTDMEITPVGYGAWAIGGADWQHGWGPQDDQDSIDTIRAAIDAGMNWIDTAAIYGLGHSEEIVAKALEGRAEKPYIFTKCSLVWDENGTISNNLQPDSLRKEVEDSLRRLNVETIDLYQIHWPNPDPQIEEGWTELAKMVEEGKLRYIGVSNFNVSQMERAQAIHPIASLQPPYSMIEPGVREAELPYCGEHNIGVIVYSPMQRGLLTGKMTRERVENFPASDSRTRDRHFKEPELTKNLRFQDLCAEIASEHDVPTPVVSIAWTLYDQNVTAAIVGARRPDQVDDIIPAMSFRLSDADYGRIEALRDELS